MSPIIILAAGGSLILSAIADCLFPFQQPVVAKRTSRHRGGSVAKIHPPLEDPAIEVEDAATRCPVAPGDGTGVGSENRTGVKFSLWETALPI